MTKKLFLIAGTAALAVFGWALSSLTTPDRALACGEWSCDCGSVQQTPMIWEMGATCQQALDRAIADARTHINCPQGVCSEGVVITSDCWWTGQEWQVDLYMVYQCNECSFGGCF